MLDCRRCKHEDCGFKKDVIGAIDTLVSYTTYTVKEYIEEIMENATEPCKDFEPIDQH